MISRLSVFFKENKKKAITLAVACILAACGVITDAAVIEHSLGLLLGW